MAVIHSFVEPAKGSVCLASLDMIVDFGISRAVEAKVAELVLFKFHLINKDVRG